jgi:AraC-like DNA-binding protein
LEIATAPEPATQHELCRTTDYDEAIDIITKVYVPHRLVLPTRAVNLSLAWTPLHHIVLGHLSYGAESHLIAPALETFYHVNITIKGRTRSTRGAEEVFTDQTTGLVFLPSQPASVYWSDDCLQLAMKIDKLGLERELEKLIAGPVTETIHFDLGLALDRAPVSGFVRALNFLRDELQHRGGVAASPLGLARLESLVMTSLLLAQRSNYSESLRADTHKVRPRAVAAVVQMMESDPAAHRTLGDFAEAAWTSARALQEGFRRHLDTTPMAYLRDVRLQHVRADLEAADASVVTVADVMSRWGFLQLGRSAAAYRARFGELPSETLRR